MKLPYVFDLEFDCKSVGDIRKEIRYLKKLIKDAESHKKDLAYLQRLCREHNLTIKDTDFDVPGIKLCKPQIDLIPMDFSRYVGISFDALYCVCIDTESLVRFADQLDRHIIENHALVRAHVRAKKLEA